jgi:hypothetical protein
MKLPKVYGDLPLDVMLQIMRSPDADIRLRAAMAQAAAPYLHRRLAPMPAATAPPVGEGGKAEEPMVYGKKEMEIVEASSPDPSTAMGALLARRMRQSLK